MTGPGGEAFGDGPLSPEVRALVRLSGALASRDPEVLGRTLEEAARRAAPGKVEEALVQSYLFLGFPAALNGLAEWRRIRGEGAGGGGGEGEEPAGPARDPMGPEGWETRGEEVCRRVYGDRYDALRENIGALHPDLDRWMVLEGYGKVLGRPGLTLPVRELCIVGLLAVLDAPVQLHSHLRGALRVGAGADEVEAALEAVDDLMAPEVRARARGQWERVRIRGEEEEH